MHARPSDPPLFSAHYARSEPACSIKKDWEKPSISFSSSAGVRPPTTHERLHSSGPIADKLGFSAVWQVPTNICALRMVTCTVSQLSPRSKEACSRPHGVNVTDLFGLLPYLPYPQMEWGSATDPKPWEQQPHTSETLLGPKLGKQVPGAAGSGFHRSLNIVCRGRESSSTQLDQELTLLVLPPL